MRDDVTPEILDRIAGAQSDTQAAITMQEAKRKLFDSIWQRKIA
jgi:hypothetical protein